MSTIKTPAKIKANTFLVIIDIFDNSAGILLTCELFVVLK